MSAPDSSATGTGVLSPLLRLLLPSSMTPPPIQHPTPLSSPTMRSEKLLRDALLKDERERQQLATPVTPPAHKRRHSHVPTSSYAGEDYTRGSFLFRTAMNNPHSPSPSPSSFSQDKDLERDRDRSPVRRMLAYGGDMEGHNAPRPQYQRRQSQQQQQSTTPHQHYTGRDSPSPSPSRNNATYPLRQGRGEPLQMSPHEQILRTRLEKTLSTSGASDGRIMRGGDQNEVRDEQGGCPWRRGTQSGGSGSGSVCSTFFQRRIYMNLLCFRWYLLSSPPVPQPQIHRILNLNPATVKLPAIINVPHTTPLHRPILPCPYQEE